MRFQPARLVAGTVVALVALLAAGAAPVASAAPVPEDRLGIQLLDAPVSGQGDPRAQSYIVDQLEPGTTIVRHVRVTNFSANPADVSLYVAAASISDGEFQFGEGHAENELTAWTSVTPPVAAMAGQTTTDLTVTIAVPQDATGGERYAVIWAEMASAPTDGGAQAINRVGIRIYLSISGVEQTSDFVIESITASRDGSGRPQITAQVVNTGERALDISGTVDLSEGPAGLQAQPAPTNETVTLLPGETQQVAATFDAELPSGPWLVTVNLASGIVAHDESATMTFPDESGAPVVAPISSWSWWWLIALALALLVLGAAWQALRVRKARHLVAV